MTPSFRILDDNLSKLMRRAYQPVRPREEFVRQLEDVLEPWISPNSAPVSIRGARRRSSRLWLTRSLAAAAALLLLSGLWRSLGLSDGFRGLVEMSLEERLDRGEVALRSSPGELWRSATPTELQDGLRFTSEELDVVTPRGVEIDVVTDSGSALHLHAESRAKFVVWDDSVAILLDSGSAQGELDGHSTRWTAPKVIIWQDGNFLMPGAEASSPTVVEGGPVIQSQRSPIQPEPSEEAAAEDRPEESSVPVTGGTLRGNVRSALEGQSISSFQVSLIHSVALPQVADTQTRSFEGDEFAWEGLEAGEYRAYITADEHAVWLLDGISLSEGVEEILDIELQSGGSILGFVVEKATGAAIEGALVVSEGEMPAQIVGMSAEQFPEGSRAFTHSAKDGSFELPLMGAGKHALRASGPGFAPTWVELVASGERTDGALFELTPGGTVEGRCEQLDGEPFDGGFLIVSRFGGLEPGRSMTFEQGLTDEKGNYRINHLSPGNYVVLFFGEPTTANQRKPKYQPVFVQEGRVHQVDFLGAGRGASVYGTVFDEQGQPVPFANLHISNSDISPYSWQGETAEADGRFEIVGLKPGGYHIFAGLGQSTALGALLDLDEGSRVNQDIHLSGTSLKVRVVDDRKGTPIGSLDLSLMDRDFEGTGKNILISREFKATAADSELQYIPTGSYDLVGISDSEEYAIALIPDVWVDAQTPVETVELRIEPASKARFTIVGEQGQSILGASVQLKGSMGSGWLPFEFSDSKSEGAVDAGRLPSGRLIFRISHPDHVSRIVELICSPDREQALTVSLSEK